MSYQYRDDSIPGYVYLVEAVGYHGTFPGCYLKRCKIGLTRDVDRRLSEFAANQPPCDIRLIKAIYVDDMADIESYLHEQYKSANVKLQRSREWFDLYPWQVLAIKSKMSSLAMSQSPEIKLKYIAALALVVAGLSMGSAGYVRSQMNQSSKVEVRIPF